MRASRSESQVRRIAGLMSWVTLALGALMTAASVYLWFDWTAPVPASPIAAEISPATQASLLALVGLPALGLMLWGLWNAFWLFRNLRGGAVFVTETGTRIHRVGLAILLLPFVSIVSGGASTVITSWNNAPGEREIAVAISSVDVVMLVAGAMLLLLGWAMAKATSIADENRQFV